MLPVPASSTCANSNDFGFDARRNGSSLMCGICGIAGAVDEAVLDRMIAALGHRGPDGHGKWLDPARRVAIGHTRLSIIELSERGSQPMQTSDGQVWITYNGE